MRNLASRLGNYLLGARRNEPAHQNSLSSWASIVSDARGIAGNLRDLIFPPLELEGEMPVRMRTPLCEQCGAFIPTRAEPPAAPDVPDAERAAEPAEGDSVVPSPEDPYRPLCNNCREHLAVHGAYSYHWARAAYRSDGQVRDAIHRFKYGGQWSLRGRLGEWLVEGYDFHAAGRRATWDGLIPVPLHPIRQYWRHFNQAAELATVLSRQRNVRYLPCLRRLRHTTTQVNLNRRDRWRNMSGAFSLRRGYDVRGMHLLVVDDVFTSGATCDACARVLRDNGAAEVGIITVARG